MPTTDPLRDELLERLRALHALKAGALRLFDPMLVSVAAARDESALSEVSDLLVRMHGAFSGHRETTATTWPTSPPGSTRSAGAPRGAGLRHSARAPRCAAAWRRGAS